MTTNKKERERLKEAMMKCLTITPRRQQEIAEMVKGRLDAEGRKPEGNGKKRGKK
jgi:hypothetical protein